MDRKRNVERDSRLEKNKGKRNLFALVLHNDDINDFNYVIESLVQICEHDAVQAEQCAYIVHYGGKCDIKTGTYANLKPMCDLLHEKGLNVTLNEYICH